MTFLKIGIHPFFLIFYLFWLLIPASYAQNELARLSGKVSEKIIRQDGKVIYPALANARVYFLGYEDNFVMSQQDGSFGLAIPASLKKEEFLRIIISKPGYDILKNPNALETIPYYTIRANTASRQRQVIFMSKKSKLASSYADSVDRKILKGILLDQNQPLENAQVHLKSIPDIYDRSRSSGTFEIYLPEDRFNPDRPFTLQVSWAGKSKEFRFLNYENFMSHNALRVRPVPELVAESSPPPQTDIAPLRPADFEEPEEEINSLESNFNRFIDDLERMNLQELSSETIKQLKDSIRNYSRLLTEFKADYLALKERSSTYNDNLLVEKQLAEKERQLTEVENELVRAELANKNKLIIILILLIILGVLFSIGYYYFIIYKKIKSQATELNRRNQYIEFLLRELNHRVSNNLQVISSMLRRKTRRLEDENAKVALKEINKRVMDIATVHAGLHSKNESRITKLHDYLVNITRTLQKLYASGGSAIRIIIRAPDVDIEHKHAVFFGLIVNELVTNSFKYAFEGVENPELLIELKKLNEEAFFIKIKDNGKGIPDSFSLQKAQSSGLRLVNLITQMLDGSFEMSNDGGTKFELLLKMK